MTLYPRVRRWVPRLLDVDDSGVDLAQSAHDSEPRRSVGLGHLDKTKQTMENNGRTGRRRYMRDGFTKDQNKR